MKRVHGGERGWNASSRSNGLPSERARGRLPALTLAALALWVASACSGAGGTGGDGDEGGATTGGPTPPVTPGPSSGGGETPTPDPTLVRASALAIGLARVDPGHYGGWSGPLAGCEPDARNMKRLAEDAGLTARTLLTEQATRQGVLDAIAEEAAVMRAGDLFVLSYSGHGGQIPDLNGDDPEDGMDETWCLYDGELLDDEIYVALGDFDPGVRVLVFSDSCHSGTAVKMRKSDFRPEAPETIERRRLLRSRFEERARPQLITINASAVREASADAGEPEPLEPESLTFRAMPPSAVFDTFDQNRAFYERLGSAVSAQARANVRCQTLLVSGCEDQELSADLGPAGGLFTVELLRTWDNGAFQGDHRDFQRAIRQAVKARNPTQSPDFFSVGATIPGFEAQRPFTKEAPAGS